MKLLNCFIICIVLLYKSRKGNRNGRIKSGNGNGNGKSKNEPSKKLEWLFRKGFENAVSISISISTFYPPVVYSIASIASILLFISSMSSSSLRPL